MRVVDSVGDAEFSGPDSPFTRWNFFLSARAEDVFDAGAQLSCLSCERSSN
jgi:hypothetical protein